MPEQVEQMEQQCIFCKIIKGEIPSKRIYEDNLVIGILDINPANLGHALLLPKQHYQIMPQVPESELSHMFKIAKYISNSILRTDLGKATTIFIANGAAAGQKAPHFMIHIIPRKNGDNLFQIPKRKASEAELERIQAMLIAKLKERIGREPIKRIKEIEREKVIPEEPEEKPQKEKGEAKKVSKEKSLDKKKEKKLKDEEIDLDKLTDLLTK